MSESEGRMSDKFSAVPEGMTATQCVYCRHRGTVGDTSYCAAFPGGIPDAIIANRADHRRPYLGDDGRPIDVGIAGDTPITFEPRDDVPQLVLDQLHEALDKLPRR
jgi:hypothetical protein